MKKRLKYIGKNIRLARQAAGLSMEELAEKADISESFLGLVERSTSGLSLEKMIEIAKVLKVTTDSLLVEEPTATLEEPTNRKTLITLIESSTDSEVDFMLDFYRVFKKQGFIKKISPSEDE